VDELNEEKLILKASRRAAAKRHRHETVLGKSIDTAYTDIASHYKIASVS
jgi:hypothetical protein